MTLLTTSSPAKVSSSDIEDVINATARGEVSIVAAPPGMGKSTAAYEAIAQRVAAARLVNPSQPYRVLWATHGTKSQKSLGREAKAELEQALTRYGLPGAVRMLRGKGWASTTKSYFAQFNWKEETAVYVVSHAHLPLLLTDDPAPHIKRFMAEVQLIVIDEDPISSLVYTLEKDSGPVTPSFLFWQEGASTASAENATKALFTVMHDAQQHKIPDKETYIVEQPISGLEMRSLTGRPFWSRLAAAMPGTPDWSGFNEMLQRAVSTVDSDDFVPDAVQKTLEDDYAELLTAPSSAPLSQRFGVVWEEGRPETVHFRGNVLRTLSGDSAPILVLDAYADESSGQYQQLFSLHRVRFIADWPIIPLEVEENADWYIHRKNIVGRAQTPRRQHVLGEIGALAHEHPAGVVVMSYQEVVNHLVRPKYREEWEGRLRPPQGLNWAKDSQSVQFAHWFSGRGVNAFRGRHVIALHAPVKPSFYQQHFMAALAPTDGNLRKRLARHLHITELLQMLHRGRQTNFAITDPLRPRVIVNFDLDKFDNTFRTSPWVTIKPYDFRRDFTKYAKRPNQPEAVVSLAEELLTLYGAVAHPCLVALGLYTPRAAEQQVVAEAHASLLSKLKTLSIRPPHLGTWDGTVQSLYPDFGVYKPATGTRVERVLANFQSSPQLSSLRSFQVFLPKEAGGGRTRVYANTEQAALEAMFDLLGYHCTVH